MKDEAKIWTNYPSDCKPLLYFAKEYKLRFVSTYIPLRYARMVYSKGLEKFDSINDEAKRRIAPLPI